MSAAILSCLEDTVSCWPLPASDSYLLFVSIICIVPDPGARGDLDVPLVVEYSLRFGQF